MFTDNIEPRYSSRLITYRDVVRGKQPTYCAVALRAKEKPKTLFKDLRFGDDLLFLIASYLSISEELLPKDDEITSLMWFIGSYDLRILNDKTLMCRRLGCWLRQDCSEYTGRLCRPISRCRTCTNPKYSRCNACIRKFDIQSSSIFRAPFHFGGWIRMIAINPIVYITRLTENKVGTLFCRNASSLEKKTSAAPKLYVSSPRAIACDDQFQTRTCKKVINQHISLQQKHKHALTKKRSVDQRKLYQSRIFDRVTKNMKLFSAESCYSDQDYWDIEYESYMGDDDSDN
uniref:Uncharacterized protein n=1 Tax=viral metagenome TaxID=1070528 RepID=A0A6C0D9H5_9ZZZZ